MTYSTLSTRRVTSSLFGEEHWRREFARYVGVKAEEKQDSRSTAKAKATGKPKPKAAPRQKGAASAKSKPKAKVVMKKPSQRS